MGSILSNSTLHARDYREEMRVLITAIAEKARTYHSGFIVIPQNASMLLYAKDGALIQPFASHISALGHEPLFSKSSQAEAQNDSILLQKANDEGYPIWTIEYEANSKNAKKLIKMNKKYNFIAYVAENRALDSIPKDSKKLFSWNKNEVTNIKKSRNFLYLINPHHFTTIQEFTTAIVATDFDAVVIDAYFKTQPVSKEIVSLLQKKTNGKRRLVLAYMSIGEAEDYRYYWKKTWKKSFPSWIVKENAQWKGNYGVRYWDKNWKAILYASKDSYIQRIVDAGFDGVYLDTIDVFTRFERGIY